METIIKQHTEKDEVILQKEHLSLIEMRQYIIDTAWSLDDYKLLKMLYIRAKTLKNA